MRYVLVLWLLTWPAWAEPPRFVTIVLGCHGGAFEGDLSAYLLAASGSTDYVCLDAGSLLTGLKEAAREGSLREVQPPADCPFSLEGYVLRNCLKAYLVSHPHYDHLLGLILNSVQDSPKPILGLASTIDAIRDHVFTSTTWANLGNEGVRPLNLYRYLRLQPASPTPIPGTSLTVEAYPLSHPVTSTAFLVGSQRDYVVYCGDTGPDAVEHSDNLAHLWDRIAPLVREGRLRALFLEASYPDGRPDSQLFGHLTPAWMMAELHQLARRVGPGQSLAGLTVVVTHIKSDLAVGAAPQEVIPRQLQERNDLGVHLVFPHQGQRLEF